MIVLTERRLRRAIRNILENCGCGGGMEGVLSEPMVSMEPDLETVVIDAGEASYDMPGDVPNPEDYELVRDLLTTNSTMVDSAVSMIMQLSGASCPISTRQAIIDHLRDGSNEESLAPIAPGMGVSMGFAGPGF